MKKLLLCLLPLLCLLSCQEPVAINPEVERAAAACGVGDPLQQLSWLKTMLEENDPNSDYCSVYQVIQGTYKGKPVFIVGVGGALCCTCAGNSVYNCEVEFVCEPDKEADIVSKKSSLGKVIYLNEEKQTNTISREVPTWLSDKLINLAGKKFPGFTLHFASQSTSLFGSFFIYI